MLVLSAVLALLASDPSLPGKAVRAPVKPVSLSTGPELSAVNVTLECRASTRGRVGDCVVLRESHPGLGFGEAAVALMTDATIEPIVKDGRPVETRFERLIEFMP